MVCTPFKCVSQVYAPLNPCGAYMSNAYLRAANLHCQSYYLNDTKAGHCWVCNCACKKVDYKAPNCCPPYKPKDHYYPKYPQCKPKCCGYSKYH